MRTAGYMTASTIVSAVVVATWVVPQAGLEVLLGMIAPLAVAVVSFAFVERTFRRDPARLTGAMIQAFAVKFLLFGAYVTVGIRVLALDTVPFISSFVVYFLALHVLEAAQLRRLVAATPSS